MPWYWNSGDATPPQIPTVVLEVDGCKTTANTVVLEFGGRNMSQQRKHRDTGIRRLRNHGKLNTLVMEFSGCKTTATTVVLEFGSCMRLRNHCKYHVTGIRLQNHANTAVPEVGGCKTTANTVVLEFGLHSSLSRPAVLNIVRR